MKANKKIIKVAWICHFTNTDVQKQLEVRRSINKFAPWISLGIEEIKKRDDIELHVISPHRWITRKKEFINNNIHYHFFNSGIFFYGRHWPGFFRFDILTNFFFNKWKIKKLVNRVNPDIINLHGIENPYYATSIFKLKAYPILITIQGLKSLSTSSPDNFFEKRIIKTEEKIIRSYKNFGIRVKFLQKHISTLNKNARFFWFKYPFGSELNKSKGEAKLFDCVFFTSITKDKGIEDLIEAITIAKQILPKISLKIIGPCKQEYRKFLDKLIVKNNLTENINFIDFINDQNELQKIVSQARISILPTYNDILPGTIIESLKLGIPTIAYAANGVTDFNEKQEIIKLIKVGDIRSLAEQIVYLLKSPNDRAEMKGKGLRYAKVELNNSIEIDKMIKAYRQIINDHNNVKIKDKGI